MAGIGGMHKRAPCYRFQPELLHDASNAFVINWIASPLQFTSNAPVAIAWKLLVNAFDLFAQVLIGGITLVPMFPVGLVVVAAGSKAGYLAGLRN
jgi:hypothetical protein